MENNRAVERAIIKATLGAPFKGPLKGHLIGRNSTGGSREDKLPTMSRQVCLIATVDAEQVALPATGSATCFPATRSTTCLLHGLATRTDGTAVFFPSLLL